MRKIFEKNNNNKHVYTKILPKLLNIFIKKN